jgi:hypothetical protein
VAKAASSVKKVTHWPVFMVPIPANRGWTRCAVVSRRVIVASWLLGALAGDIPARSRNQSLAELPDTENFFRDSVEGATSSIQLMINDLSLQIDGADDSF